MLSPLIFKYALEYAITRIQANQEGLKLNGAHKLLVYAHEVNTSGSIHTIKKTKEALAVVSMVIGLEGDAQKTASRTNHKIKTDNKSINRVEQFKYLETTPINQNSTHTEINSKLKPGMLALIASRIFVFQFAIQKYKD
jgi:hypothetical protein